MWPWLYVSVVRSETTRVHPKASRQARRSESEPVGVLTVVLLLSLMLFFNDPVSDVLLLYAIGTKHNPESYMFILHILDANTHTDLILSQAGINTH